VWLEVGEAVPEAVDVGSGVWVGVCVGGGYAFGNVRVVKENFSLVALGIVAVSLIPIAVEWWKHARRKKGQRE